MAKDNLFLGFGRGKVGDVVFYRSNGTQITRARNRNPRNPNSVPQRVVRAVNASVSRLYSIGQEIFNHSFEGASTPADNQRRFNSLNINLLRGLIADDLNSGRVDGACLARVGARGLSAAVPFNGMQLSSGKLPNNAFEMKSDGRFGMPEPLHSTPAVYTETVAEYATRIGLVEGDIYTFVMIGTPGTTDSQLAYYGAEGEAFNPCAAIFPFFFNYAQLIVKAEAFTNTDTISTGTKLSAIFGASDRGINLTNLPLVVLFTPADIDSRMINGVAGCIHSRESTGLRSTTFGIAFQSLPGENGDWGLTTNYLAQAWQTGDSNLRGDELILDGKYFEPSQGGGSSERIIQVSPVLPSTTQPNNREQYAVFGEGLSWDTFDRMTIMVNDTPIHMVVDKSSPDEEEWIAAYNQDNIKLSGAWWNENLIRFTVLETSIVIRVSAVTLDS